MPCTSGLIYDVIHCLRHAGGEGEEGFSPERGFEGRPASARYVAPRLLVRQRLLPRPEPTGETSAEQRQHHRVVLVPMVITWRREGQSREEDIKVLELRASKSLESSLATS